MTFPWTRPLTTSLLHPLPVPSALAKQDLKRTTVLATQSANRSWHPATGGNFSVRDGDICWVSPSGKHKGLLEWTAFLPVDFAKAELVQPCYVKPSDETALHCAVYRADPTARAVMHVHPPHTTALVGTDFNLSDNEMLKAFGFKTHETNVVIPSLPNTQDMEKLGRDVKLNLELKLLVLEGHGVYAWGRNPDEAMFRIEALEFLCQLRKSPAIPVKWLGTVSYKEGYEQQELHHAQVVAGELPGCILVLEHKPVLTLGKHADPSLIFINEEERDAQGIDLVQTDRGGEVTAHMPGQLVVYPILPLVALKIQPRAYVNILLRAVIDTLAVWGIESRCDAEHPGVWVGDNKICAIGVRIRERVSMHGIALNANNSLDLFERIVPCGIRNRGVTSMALELDRVIDMDALQSELVRRLELGLGIGPDLQASPARIVGAPQACQV